jgi:hypothetical protein
LRQAFADGFFATDFAGDPRGHRLTIAGNHRDAPDAAFFEFGERLFCFRAGFVLQAGPADAFAVARDEDQAPAFRFIEVDRFEEIIFDAVILEPLRAADEDRGAIDLRLDAAAGGFREIFRF